jgi:hypothetical protein
MQPIRSQTRPERPPASRSVTATTPFHYWVRLVLLPEASAAHAHAQHKSGVHLRRARQGEGGQPRRLFLGQLPTHFSARGSGMPAGPVSLCSG